MRCRTICFEQVVPKAEELDVRNEQYNIMAWPESSLLLYKEVTCVDATHIVLDLE